MNNPRKKLVAPPRPNARKAGEVSPDIPDIFRAAASDDAPALDVALESGADVNAVDNDLMTPLHYAAGHRANRAIDRLLQELDSKENPLNPTLQDRFGRSASSIALEVWGVLGVEIADKLRPYCYPSNENDALS